MTTTTGSPPNLYPGEYWYFTVTITKNGAAPDITGDVVTCTIKHDTTGAVLLTINADVASQGANGIAVFSKASADTADLAGSEGVHPCDVWWYPSDDEDCPLYVDTVQILERVSTVPS